MKKLLSIAVAAAVAAPMAVMADTTLYGRIDNALTHHDTGAGGAWDVQEGNGVSRIGVKGSEDLGNGLKAIFQYEWDTTTSEGNGSVVGGSLANRLGYVGLSGGFGTVSIGRQWGQYYFAVNKTDIMNAPNQNAANFQQSLMATRIGNAVGYVSPNFNGFTGAIAMVMDNAGGDAEDGVDRINAALKYDNGPLSLGLGYRTDASNSAVNAGASDIDTWGLGAKYNFGNFAVMASYEDQDAGATDEQAFALGAEAYFGNNIAKIRYSELDTANSDSWTIGLQHNFSKRTRIYAEYADADINGTDKDQLALGLRHDF